MIFITKSYFWCVINLVKPSKKKECFYQKNLFYSEPISLN